MTESIPPQEKPILPDRPMLLISTDQPPVAYINEPYHWKPEATGGYTDDYTFHLVSGMPPEGMTFKDGLISGTCPEEGETNLTIAVFDGQASISHPYVLKVAHRPKLSVRAMLSSDDIKFHDLIDAYTQMMMDPNRDGVKTCAVFCKIVDWLVLHPTDYALNAMLSLFTQNKDSFMEERSALQGFGHRGIGWQDEERQARVVYAYFRSLSQGQKTDSLFGKLLSVTHCPQLVNFFRKKSL